MANFNINPGLMAQLADPYRGSAEKITQGFDRGLQMGLIKKQQQEKQQRQQIADAYKMIDTASSVLSKGKKLPKETRAMYTQILTQGHNVLAQHWGMDPISPDAELDDNDQPYIDEINEITNQYTSGKIGYAGFQVGYMGSVNRAAEEGEIDNAGATRLVNQMKQIQKKEQASRAAMYQGLLQHPRGGGASPVARRDLMTSYAKDAPEHFLKLQQEQQKAKTKQSSRGMTIDQRRKRVSQITGTISSLRAGNTKFSADMIAEYPILGVLAQGKKDPASVNKAIKALTLELNSHFRYLPASYKKELMGKYSSAKGLPDPIESSGKTVIDNKTGVKYKSDGYGWMRVK